jgi:murein DD-endopeptidase MepM/ murein hydrolase activator NlpD
MAKERRIAISRVAVRLMCAAGAAALMAGCADSSRFADPFTDPFGAGKKSMASRQVDQAPTGSIQQDLPSRQAAIAPVESRPLPAPVAASPVAPAPVAASMPGPLPGADPHWTTNGGTPVVMAQGETPVMLANRYGVPADALVKANGYATTAAVHPGAKLIIPVYRANSNGAVAKTTPVAAPAPQQLAAGGGVSGKVTEAKAEPKPAAAPVMTKTERLAQRQEEMKAEREKLAAKEAERKTALAKAQEELRAKKTAELDAKAKKQAELKAKADADKAAKAQAKNDSLKYAANKPAAAVQTAQAANPVAPVQVAKTEQKIAAATPADVKASNVDTTSTGAIHPDVLKPNSAVAETQKPSSGDVNHPEFRWPVRGRIIQGFANGGDGINIAVPEGTQVKAVEEGEVAFAGSELKGYGNMILIRHPNGYVSAYAHNSELEVKRGDKVKRGQNIAKSGQTGNVGSTPVDPTTYLAGL